MKLPAVLFLICLVALGGECQELQVEDASWCCASASLTTNNPGCDVGVSQLAQLLSKWGAFDGSLVPGGESHGVSVSSLALLLSQWGPGCHVPAPVFNLIPSAESLTYVHFTVKPGFPDDMYLVTRYGYIDVLSNGSNIDRWLDFESIVEHQFFEQGVYSMAWHPIRDEAYFAYTRIAGREEPMNIVARVLGSEDYQVHHELIRLEVVALRHNLGEISFSPWSSSSLIVPFGDGGWNNYEQAQNPNNLYGSLVSLDVDTLQHIQLGYGLRNAWRVQFDDHTNRFYMTDSAQDRFEELNVLSKQQFSSAQTEEPINFGWATIEGSHCYDPSQPFLVDDQICTFNGTHLPQFEYYILEDSSLCSMIGGGVYRGKYAPLWGYYIYGDFCSDSLYALKFDDHFNVIHHRRFASGIRRPTTFGHDSKGNFYVGTYRGEIYQMI